MPDEGTGTISRTRVTGSSFGVAALEISEALDILAGAIVDEADLEIPTSHSSSSVNLPGMLHDNSFAVRGFKHVYPQLPIKAGTLRLCPRRFEWSIIHPC